LVQSPVRVILLQHTSARLVQRNTMSEIKSEQNNRRVLLVGDTTLDPLARWLERSQELPQVQASAAPYGQIYQILLDGNHSAWSSDPHTLVVWTTPDLTLPAFARLLRFEFESAAAEHDGVLREAERFADAVLKAADRVGLILVPTWILPTHERWIQTLVWRNGVGPANLLARANLILAEKFAGAKNIVLMDAAYWQASLPRSAFDPRMFAVAKILYSQNLYEKAAAEMKAVMRGALGQTRKVMVCDLDNTLWGGIVGDDGAQNLKLGSPDPLGECFCAFQKTLKGFAARGILLAICSKNEEETALSVIEEHPAMLLRKNDFVAWRINWKNKAENLVELADELNLGLDSFVFLDDSPQERDQIRQLLPQVLTPDLPQSPSDYAPFLSSLNCFETSNIGKEDWERTQMYRAERDRKDSMDLSGGIEGWLGSLQIEVKATQLRRENLPRAAQLLNKTNQFNLSLRRLDEKSFWDWAEDPSHSIYTFNVSDRFGDFGLVGLSSFSLNGGEAQITDFVMSCRVMGKKVEEALLGYTVECAKASGANRVIAAPVDGPRNEPARTFFAAKGASNGSTLIDPEQVTIPAHITLRVEN
jgi:FkbH-like protein